MKRGIVVGIVCILICSSIPAFASMPSRDPHVHLEGVEGTNEWYVSSVNVTIDAPAQYQLDNGSWIIYTSPFKISIEGCHLLVATGNYNGSNWTEEYHINIDKTPPMIIVSKEITPDRIIYTAVCSDNTSGMNRVEFYMNGILRETDLEAPYYWTYFFYTYPFTLTGVIKKPQFSEDNIAIPVIIGVIKPNRWNLSFSAIPYDNAGNNASVQQSYYYGPFFAWVFFETLIMPNHYKGYLGRFFVHALFFEN